MSKKILITGAGSFVGEAVRRHLLSFGDAYAVDVLDMKSPSWRDASFASYDAVFHVAGKAHVDMGRVKDTAKESYYRINTDLAVEAAKKAKEDGAGQFIFMSSVTVYGSSAPIGKPRMIDKNTPTSPNSVYADSKLKAEEAILPLSSPDFCVSVLRPPMIYGKGCNGNYPHLSRLAAKAPFFPSVKNRRSMLFVGNLAEFVRLLIDNRDGGIFFPQNGEYVSTCEMARLCAACHGKALRFTRLFNWLVLLLSPFVPSLVKAFGNFAYEMEMSDYPQPYRLFDLASSICESEKES